MSDRGRSRDAGSVAQPLAELRGRRVLVAGAGVSGLAAARALVELGARVTVTDAVADRLATLPDGVDGALEMTEPPADTALIVTSPGWRPDAPLLVAAARESIEVIGEPELAWRWTQPGGPGAGSPAPRWLAVTGTNGKTTTVNMLATILTSAGRDAVACGNVGNPVIEAVCSGRRELAVELSSFQLHWSPSIRPHAGCLLNIAEDHLDWHGGMAEYLAAKARILTGAVAVGGVDDPAVATALGAAPAGRRVGITLKTPRAGELGVADGALVDRAFSPPGSGSAEPTILAKLDEINPPGPSGWLDALGAAALARAAGVDPASVRAGLAAFSPGPHRGTVVGEIGGVRFVDNSKATNPHAASAALAAYPRVVWVAGGLLKGASVTELIKQHAHRFVGVVLLGTDRGMFRDALLRHAPNVPVVEVTPRDHEPMIEAVRLAAGMAAPGDVVLLAPAAASLDQFASYAARGDAFAAAVAALPAVPR